MEDLRKVVRPYLSMALEAYDQYQPIAVAHYGIVRTQMEKVLQQWQKTTEGKYSELQVQYPSLPSSVPFHLIFSPETVIGVIGVFTSFMLCRCLCNCCCGASRNKSSKPSSAAGKKNKKKVGTTSNAPSTATSTSSSKPAAAGATSTNGTSAPSTTSTKQPAAASSSGTSINMSSAPSSGEPDVTNTTVKQLLKIKRAELQELQALKAAKENKQYNKRERKQAQKLEDMIAQLANCPTNKQGFALHPEQFLKNDEEDDQQQITNKKKSGGRKQSDNDDDDNLQSSTKNNNKGSEAKLIDIQNKLGLSMEQATAAAIAMSLHAEIAPEGEEDGSFTSVGGKKKKKAAGPGGLSRQEMKDGWEVVSKKK